MLMFKFRTNVLEIVQLVWGCLVSIFCDFYEPAILFTWSVHARFLILPHLMTLNLIDIAVVFLANFIPRRLLPA
jgi:hypothetical protein